MLLTDLIETWLRSKPVAGWGVCRYPGDNVCDYILCREHTWPMTEGDDYVVAIFPDHITAFTKPVVDIQAGDPLFLDKLWHILDAHNKEYHDYLR